MTQFLSGLGSFGARWRRSRRSMTLTSLPHMFPFLLSLFLLHFSRPCSLSRPLTVNTGGFSSNRETTASSSLGRAGPPSNGSSTGASVSGFETLLTLRFPSHVQGLCSDLFYCLLVFHSVVEEVFIYFYLNNIFCVCGNTLRGKVLTS